MERIDPTSLSPRALSTALLEAPGWARIGLTMPDEKLRERAAQELVETIFDHLANPRPVYDESQLPLPI